VIYSDPLCEPRNPRIDVGKTRAEGEPTSRLVEWTLPERTFLRDSVQWLWGFVPAPTAVAGRERLRACAGALTGILLTGLMTHWLLGASAPLPLLIAPMGASA
jgi:hypothetical protein